MNGIVNAEMVLSSNLVEQICYQDEHITSTKMHGLQYGGRLGGEN